jgi:hypothetical protein
MYVRQRTQAEGFSVRRPDGGNPNSVSMQTLAEIIGENASSQFGCPRSSLGPDGDVDSDWTDDEYEDADDHDTVFRGNTS